LLFNRLLKALRQESAQNFLSALPEKDSPHSRHTLFIPIFYPPNPFANGYKQLDTDVNVYQPIYPSLPHHLCSVKTTALWLHPKSKNDKKTSFCQVGMTKEKEKKHHIKTKKEYHEPNLQQCTTDRKSGKRPGNQNLGGWQENGPG
jgi:hypothetical protein